MRRACSVTVLTAVLAAGMARAATWNVLTVSQLTSAVNNAVSGDVILVQPGTYVISTELWMRNNGLTLRGATGDAKDVLLQGKGLNNPAYARIPLHIDADYITVENITSGECYWHAIQLSPGADYATIRNCVTRNAGEQHIKGSKFTVGGRIENVLMENTYQRINDGIDRPDDYLGGIDLHGAVGWTIRHCVARNIIGEGTDGSPDGDAGIFLWNESSDCITEYNVIIGCNKGISYGIAGTGKAVYHMTGGIIRNNCIVNLVNGDLGIEIGLARNVNVYNNTLYSIYNLQRTLLIYHNLDVLPGLPTYNVDVRNNIIRGQIRDYTAATGWSGANNIVSSTLPADWFADALGGNLHLTKAATTAIGQAAILPDVTDDFDGQSRPIDAAPDIGADEFVLADLDGDGHCDVIDLLTFAAGWALSAGEPGYDGNCDFNADNTVDVIDLLTFSEYWGL